VRAGRGPRRSRLNGWVTNAAVFRDAGLATAKPSDVLDLIVANPAPAVIGSAIAVRRFLAAGTGGAIVNVSSHQAQRAVRGALPYTTAKAATEGLTRAAAVDHGPAGIRVNAVALGSIRTDRYDAYLAEQTPAPPSASSTRWPPYTPSVGSGPSSKSPPPSPGSCPTPPASSPAPSCPSMAVEPPGDPTPKQPDRALAPETGPSRDGQDRLECSHQRSTPSVLGRPVRRSACDMVRIIALGSLGVVSG
jgi:hypothetical protein